MASVVDQATRAVYDKLGVTLKGANEPRGPRDGYSFWFENYTRGEGPLFALRPSGLRRQAVTVEFGPYASACISHIQENDDQEAFAVAMAFLDEISARSELSINGERVSESLDVQEGFSLKALRRADESGDFTVTIEKLLVPLVAAFAELIGYEDYGYQTTEEHIEGSVYELTVIKRERSLRNRLLCLSIHGERCGVCGGDPKDTYRSLDASIIEVHHIEPLAAAESPRPYDPKTDLIPLCPNCHRAIHKRNPPYSPEELRKLLDQ